MAYLTYAGARAALDRNETSCEALVSFFLSRIEADNDRLNIFVDVDAEGALARARSLDAEWAQGSRRPLAGMVVAVKDVICMAGRPVTCGSRILQGFRSLYDATVIERLAEAGAIFIGRTNCDEFAMGSSNENSFYGPVRNPVAESRVPGGSSGGSAAAVAAGMCHVALGSDTGGSIRQPAAFCGVHALKPTYGRVSRFGLVAYASSLDSIGPLAACPEDLALVLGVIAGHDPHDATSAPVPVPQYTDALGTSVAGLRVGLPDEYYAEGLDPEIRAAAESMAARLREAGAEVRRVALPYTEYGIATYYILAMAEASSNLARYDGVRYGYRADEAALRREARSDPGGESLLARMYVASRTEGFGAEVKRRIMLGTYVLSSGYYDAYYAKAQRVRALIRKDFDRALADVDVLLTPVTPGPAFPLGSKADDPLAMYLSDVYTVTANLAGLPGMVVPVGRHTGDEALPIGLQLLGRPFEEARLLAAGDALWRLASA